MKKRKWHKITAALATVAVILSSPGITDLVKGSSTEFVDIVPISEETIPASENEEKHLKSDRRLLRYNRKTSQIQTERFF